MRIDLHVHTSNRSACGQVTQEEQVQAGIDGGLDTIAFADHHTLAPEQELAGLRREFAPFRLFSAIEITVIEREDIVVVGLRDPELQSMEWSWPDLHAFVSERSGFMCLAHPFRYHDDIAIDISAIHNGYSVLYKNAFDLVQEMADAEREDGRKEYVRMMTAKVGLLIIDELGMKQMPKNAADDLLEIIHRRYQTSATIIATNRVVSDWGNILGDNAATAAILDRFLDEATIISIKGKSYRLAKKNQKERVLKCPRVAGFKVPPDTR